MNTLSGTLSSSVEAAGIACPAVDRAGALERSVDPTSEAGQAHESFAAARVRDLASRLASQQFVSDLDFDDVFPLAARMVSYWFWTPVAVALRAAGLLARAPCRRVLDVGSGVGKFCIVGAAATGVTFVGVEHREHLVRAARQAARLVGIASAEFVHGTIDAVDVVDFDAIYLFNPFEENLWHRELRLDDEVELSARRFAADVARVQRMLERARLGTRVVTFWGFGGQMPAGYWQVLRERTRCGDLDLWIKAKTRSEAIWPVGLAVAK